MDWKRWIATILISSIGLACHQFTEFPGAWLYNLSIVLSMMFIPVLLLFMLYNFHDPHLPCLLFIALAMLHIVGGIITVVPLSILPFYPEQTIGHYISHIIYGVCQLPLIHQSVNVLNT